MSVLAYHRQLNLDSHTISKHFTRNVCIKLADLYMYVCSLPSQGPFTLNEKSYVK